MSGHGHSHPSHHVHHHHCCVDHSCGHCACCSEHKHKKGHDDKDEKKKPEKVSRYWRLIAIVAVVSWVLFLGAIIALSIRPHPSQMELTIGCPPIGAPAGTVQLPFWQKPKQPGAIPGKSYPLMPGDATHTIKTWLSRTGSRPAGDPNIDLGILDAATRLAISEIDGSPVAGSLRKDVPLSSAEEQESVYDFWNESDKDGVLGFYRLALGFLGYQAFVIARDSPWEGLYVPYCATSSTRFVPFESLELSYVYFSIIVDQCDSRNNPNAEGWLDGIHDAFPEKRALFSRWRIQAGPYFKELMKKHGLDPADSDDRGRFCLGSARGKFDKSALWRCDDASKSRQALKYGDAAAAKDEKEQARACWRKAIELAKESPDGKPAVDADGATAAILAQKRLQTNETTCKWTKESVAAISRDYKARSGDLIHVKVLQQALKALGHYDGDRDGQLSQQTRAAMRKFQREREEDETDTLTPEQTVALICNAAETARDLEAQTTLGIMYATGLGVEQNIDQAHYWLMSASNQHYPDATYNLAILYGTGVVLGSYRLCDVPRTPEQADRFLEEASGLKQPIAMALMKRYGPKSEYANLSPRERWALIEMQQLENSPADKTGLYAKRIASVGAKCP